MSLKFCSSVGALAFLLAVFLLASQVSLQAAPAPPWELKNLQGQTVKLSDFKGKVVLLDFWATWCPPCLEEIPNFIDLQKTYGKQGLAVIGVSMDDAGPKVVSKFVQAHQMNYTVVMGTQPVFDLYSSGALPTTCVIDRQGKILATHAGFVGKATVEAEIKKAL